MCFAVLDHGGFTNMVQTSKLNQFIRPTTINWREEIERKATRAQRGGMRMDRRRLEMEKEWREAQSRFAAADSRLTRESCRMIQLYEIWQADHGNQGGEETCDEDSEKDKSCWKEDDADDSRTGGGCRDNERQMKKSIRWKMVQDFVTLTFWSD